MITFNQYNETNNKQQFANNISFSSRNSAFLTLKSSKDLITLSETARIKSDAQKWIKSHFKSAQELYNACLNSDSNISEIALNFLKGEFSKRKKPFFSFFKRKVEPTYYSFGDKFISLMLEAVKNNDRNHTQPNIAFLQTILSNYDDKNPKNYLDLIINSKDDEGNINPETSSIFNMLYSKESNNVGRYTNFMKCIHSLPKSEQNFIFSNWLKHHDKELFKILQLSQGSDSEKLIENISENLNSGLDSQTITTSLEKSKDAKGHANSGNYRLLLKKKLPLDVQDEYEYAIKDKNGIIQDSNIAAVTELIKFFGDRNVSKNRAAGIIRGYIYFLKDENGVVNQQFAKSLIENLNHHDNPEDYENNIECIKLLTNKKGDIQWKYINPIYELMVQTDISRDAQNHGTFNEIMDILTDKEGNIIPKADSYILEIKNMIENDLLIESPIILKMAQNDTGLDHNLCKTLIEYIQKEPPHKRFDAAQGLAKLKNKDGFDKELFLKLVEITNLKINGDRYKILGILKNSDNKVSQLGFDFLTYLRKECGFNEEKDLISFLQLSKNEQGDFIDDNISYIKEMRKVVRNNEAVKKYIISAKQNAGTINKDYCDNLIKVLSQNKQTDDFDSVLESIKALTNKKGDIQWEFVNYIAALKRHTDKSSNAQKHDTFGKILNLLTDKDGNIIPSFNEYVSEINKMTKDDLLIEIPVILSIAQKDGAPDGELCSAIKAMVLDEPKDKRYETAKRLADLAKNGFDKNFFTKLNKISNLKINGDKYKIMNELKNADDKISQIGFDFLVYLRKECSIKEENDIISFLKLSKDKSGNFSNENISYIKDISKIVPKYNIAKIYINASKQNTGIVNKDYYNNLIDILSKNGHPEDYKNILACIGSAKNKKGDIQWSYVNNLYKLKTICDESKMGKKFKTFSKILNVLRDQDGNIVPEFVEATKECQQEKMLYEIPTIISLSKNKDKLDKDNYKKIVKILKNTATEDRYKMSEYVKKEAEKTGSLNNPKIKIIERLQASNISKNLLGIYHYLKNPDGSISVTGLNLITDLRKTYHHQIEPDLGKILKVCRDKTGYINQKNVNALKELLHINKDIDAVGLIKSSLNRKGEVDSDKYKTIIKLITEHHMSNAATINKVINMSRDKKGDIDSGILKLFVTLAKKGKKPEDYNKIIPAYKALYKYENATSLSQLNIRQKRDLMRALKRYYHSDMQTYQFKEILSSKLFPADESEYCSVMGRLSHSIGISVKRLPKDVEAKYYKAMRTLENPKGDFMNWDFDKNPPVLELKYPLKDFKRDIMDAIANYSYSERTKALDYYGFELKKTDGIVKLSGFPNTDKPDGRLSSIKDKLVLHLINKLSPYVIEFSQHNKVTVKGSKEMSEALTDIITAFPEFLTTVGKRQHRTHDFTLDVHSLKVLQDVFNNPQYKTLSHTDRKEMQIIALFHDLSKTEMEVDKEHPENSAFNVYYLLNKLDMKEKDKLEIYNVIRNHDWLTHFDFSEYATKDIAFNMRGSESLKMLLMLSQADLKGVKKHDAYYKMYGGKLKKAGMKIQPYLRDLQRTAIYLPQTKIPKASELNQRSGIVDKIHADGITNTVLYLKPNYDLGKAGFKTCRSTDDFNVLVHGLDSKDAASMFQALGIIDSDALLSTSYILYSKGNYRAFRNEGFVLDVPATNIHVAYWRDFGSGYRKTISDNLYNTYLFRNNPMRNYISDALRQELRLTDKEYIQLFKEIEDMPIEELEKKHPHTAKAYRKLFNDMEVSKRSFGRNYNEVLLSSPKIQGIFCYGKSPESVSAYLRRYAERNNIPIIVFG